jgi:Asp-tRNA(Asn)/Glu-tRNA(Gln) amidotransferase A subunit family amidase
MPPKHYPEYAKEKSLSGIRIGVVREYMSKKLFTPADYQTIDIVSAAVDDLRKLGADVVDPGPEGELFTGCLRKYVPAAENKLFTKRFPEMFPVDKDGKPVGDHVSTLVDLTVDPSKVPDAINLRSFGSAQAVGEAKYQLDVYLRKRGDANIHSNTDLVNKANYYDDPKFVSQKTARENADKPLNYDMADRMLHRFAVQQVILQCMQEQNLDAVVYPTAALPPAKIGAPPTPQVACRGGVWTFLGAQGFPAMTVPAGFTTETYDWVRDPSVEPAKPSPECTGGAGGGGNKPEGVRMVGPTPAKLPVGMDILARPFGEPVIFKIASAYTAATKHRTPPPDFGPVP